MENVKARTDRLGPDLDGLRPIPDFRVTKELTNCQSRGSVVLESGLRQAWGGQ